MDAMTQTRVEAELREATAIKTDNPKETRLKFLARLARAVDRLPQDDWLTLSERAQNWTNAAIKAMANKRPVRDFDAPPEEELPEEPEARGGDEDDDDPPASSEDAPERNGDEDDEDAPAEAPPPRAKKTPPPPSMPPRKKKGEKKDAETRQPEAIVGDPQAQLLDAGERSASEPAKRAAGKRAKNAMWSTPGASTYWRRLCVEFPAATKEELDAKMAEKNLVLAPGSASVIRHNATLVLRILRELGRLA